MLRNLKQTALVDQLRRKPLVLQHLSQQGQWCKHCDQVLDQSPEAEEPQIGPTPRGIRPERLQAFLAKRQLQ